MLAGAFPVRSLLLNPTEIRGSNPINKPSSPPSCRARHQGHGIFVPGHQPLLEICFLSEVVVSIVLEGESNIKGARSYVVDCDLAAFFDTVDHQKLMGKLHESYCV